MSPADFSFSFTIGVVLWFLGTNQVMKRLKAGEERDRKSAMRYRRYFAAYVASYGLILVALFCLFPTKSRGDLVRIFLDAPELVAVGFVAFAALLGFYTFSQVRLSYEVTKRFASLRMLAAFSMSLGLLALVTIYSFIYWIAGYEPNSCFDTGISKIDAVYFTLTTLTTTGFGDLSPVSQTCRVIVSSQMVVGFVVVTIVLA